MSGNGKRKGDGKVMGDGFKALAVGVKMSARRQAQLTAQIEACRAGLRAECQRYPEAEALQEAAELRVRHLASTTKLSLWQAFAKVTRELRGVENQED